MFGINKTSNIQTLDYKKIYCHLIVNPKFRQSLSEIM